MATYTAITDAEIDQDSPITQTLMTKYRDNLTASIEGADSAPRILSPALALSFKTGTATRTTSGTSTIVTLNTADLANLADMGVALLMGTVEVSSDDTLTTRIASNRVSSPTYLLETKALSGSYSFSHLVELSSATSINLSLSIIENGTSSVTAYGQIIILGR